MFRRCIACPRTTSRSEIFHEEESSRRDNQARRTGLGGATSQKSHRRSVGVAAVIWLPPRYALFFHQFHATPAARTRDKPPPVTWIADLRCRREMLAGDAAMAEQACAI